MNRMLLIILAPIAIAGAQGDGPFARVGLGVGAVEFEGGPTTTIEAGARLNPYVGFAVEHSQLAGQLESGKWTLVSARGYPFRAGRYIGLWVALGVGTGSARMFEGGGPRRETYYRARGMASMVGAGLEIRLLPHVYFTPAAASRSVGGNERRDCTRDISPSGVFSPWACSGWVDSPSKLSAFEFSVGITAR